MSSVRPFLKTYRRAQERLRRYSERKNQLVNLKIGAENPNWCVVRQTDHNLSSFRAFPVSVGTNYVWNSRGNWRVY